MIKLVYCIKKRSDLDPASFRHYWKAVHGPIGAQIPGLRRLVQSHALELAGEDRPADFDGMAELWFDDVGALRTARSSAAWCRSTADEVNFVGEAAYFVSEEHQIVTDEGRDREAIEATLERWYRGIEEGDGAALEPLLTEDAVAMVPESPALEGRAQVVAGLRSYFGRYRQQLEFRVDAIEISQGLAVASLSERTRVQPVAAGEPVALSQKGIFVLRRGAEGSWRVARLIGNLNHPLR